MNRWQGYKGEGCCDHPQVPDPDSGVTGHMYPHSGYPYYLVCPVAHPVVPVVPSSCPPSSTRNYILLARQRPVSNCDDWRCRRVDAHPRVAPRGDRIVCLFTFCACLCPSPCSPPPPFSIVKRMKARFLSSAVRRRTLQPRLTWLLYCVFRSCCPPNPTNPSSQTLPPRTQPLTQLGEGGG